MVWPPSVAEVRVNSICCPLRDFLCLTSGPVINIESQKPDLDDLDLWHQRLADTSHCTICETVLKKHIERWCLIKKNSMIKFGRAIGAPVHVRRCIYRVFQRDHIHLGIIDHLFIFGCGISIQTVVRSLSRQKCLEYFICLV